MIFQKVQQFIEAHRLFNHQHRLLIAVSGGLDSMVLLHVMKHLEYEFAVAHCNFGLRGEASEGDAQFVQEMAKSLGVECFVQHFSKGDAEKRGTQEWARAVRYAWFEELSVDRGFDRILVAHHQDDQAETMLMNLVRGSGVTGLAGMLPLHGRLARPLLGIARAELEAFAKAASISFREDETNAEEHYQRNFVRHRIVPLLQELNPKVSAELAATAERMRKLRTALDGSLANVYKLVAEQKEGALYLKKKELLATSDPSFWLFELLREYSFSFELCSQVVRDVGEAPGAVYEHANAKLYRDRECLIVTRKEKLGAIANSFSLQEPSGALENPLRVGWGTKDAARYEIQKRESIAALDFDLLTFPLQFRRWETGDRFHPLGMEHSKLLSDFMIDTKLSRYEKERIWVLCSGEDVVWVVGHRIDHRYRITPQTRQVFEVELR